jgi:membrane protein implicated in regulation of membrane protease activity
VLYPGLGHVYLRKWGRALLWFVLVVVSSTFLIPDGAVPSSLSMGALVDAAEAIPVEVSLLILTLSFVSVLDAYWLANRVNERARPTVDEQGQVRAEDCPNCGKELDEDIEFCPWCSERLVGPEETDDEEPTAG